MPADQRRCACCGFDVTSLVEVAHIPNWRTNPEKYLPLCLLCHRAYDLGLLTEAEIEEMYAGFGAGSPPPHSSSSIREIWATREPDWKKLQQGAGERAGRTRRRKSAARKAADTRLSERTTGQ